MNEPKHYNVTTRPDILLSYIEELENELSKARKRIQELEMQVWNL
jgi:hypothetical protein